MLEVRTDGFVLFHERITTYCWTNKNLTQHSDQDTHGLNIVLNISLQRGFKTMTASAGEVADYEHIYGLIQRRPPSLSSRWAAKVEG